jgi:preprotein translocase subunit SecE
LKTKSAKSVHAWTDFAKGPKAPLRLEKPRRSAYLAGNPRQARYPMAMTNPIQFIQQVRTEVSKVTWPTRREVVLTTIMVFIMAALTAVFFSLVDVVIRFGLTAILNAF